MANKEILSTRIYEILEDTTVEGVRIMDILTPSQIYQIVIDIVNGLPYDNTDKVRIVNENLEFPVYNITELVQNKKGKELMIPLFYSFLWSCKSLHISKFKVYEMFIELFGKVYYEEVEEPVRNINYEEILSNMLEILFESYSILIKTQSEEVIHEGMLEIMQSRLSLIHENIEEVKDTVAYYQNKDIKIDTRPLSNQEKYIVTEQKTTLPVNANMETLNLLDLIKKLEEKWT